MNTPNYWCNLSLVENKIQVHGNVELAKDLIAMIRKKCIGSFELYEAQEYIHNYCVDTYGANFYEKSSEAIQYIVENEYCHIERNKQPAFDMKQYEKDMRSGVMY